MNILKEKKVLISGASIAGLSTAYWMNKLGYKVTIVEISNELRTAGSAVDIKGIASDAIKRMGIFAELKSNRLIVETIEFKNADDITEGSISIKSGLGVENTDIEIERDKFLGILFDKLENEIEFVFNNSIKALNETSENVQVLFENGLLQSFDLVIGCDGVHSRVRKICFGHESAYSHFLKAYFSITIAEKLLINNKTIQMYNEPDRGIILNAYNNKTDIVFCFFSEKEILYDFQNEEQQRQIILEKFVGQKWKSDGLLQEIKQCKNFYFDKFCQIKMPAWTKSRIALVGDAGYSASPASGMGASLAIAGAMILADALDKHDGNFNAAFEDYNHNLRPYIEVIQFQAVANIEEKFLLKTEEAIRERNRQTISF